MPRSPRADEAGGLYHALNRRNSRAEMSHKATGEPRITRNTAEIWVLPGTSLGSTRAIGKPELDDFYQKFMSESVYAGTHPVCGGSAVPFGGFTPFWWMSLFVR